MLGGRAGASGWTRGLATSTARWDLLAQQVFVAQKDSWPGPGLEEFAMDAWDGYPRGSATGCSRSLGAGPATPSC